MVIVAGKMYRPTDVVADIATNSVFVVEQFNHRISKWDYTDTNYDFTLDASWGSNGDGTSGVGAPIGDGGPTDNALYRPTGIVFDGTRLVVTDTFHNRIRTLAIADGAFIASTGQGGSGDTDFYHPAGIAVNETPDTLFIADELNHRVLQYNLGNTPSFFEVLDDPSVTTGLSFVRPHGVTYDVTDDLFDITDTARGIISRYEDETGDFVDQQGTPGTEGIEMFFPGSGTGLLGGTATTVFADTRNNILKTINANLIANTTGTTRGTGNGQLYYPESASAFVDAATNYVLAANTLNNRVEAYSSATAALTFQANFGSP